MWRQIFRDNITSLSSLCTLLELSPDQISQLDSNSHFPLNIPRRIVNKMEKGSITDPLFRQFVPLKEERCYSKDFLADPVSDTSFIKTPSLLKKYHSRALVVTCGTCAMHCRYCFRKNFSYPAENKTFEKEIEYITSHKEIDEVILSGGDPLSLSNRVLDTLFRSIEEIPHVKRIRFHTRFPIGIPERIDEAFLEILKKSSKKIWFLIHSNHPKEFDQDIWEALEKIQKLGIPVLNQAVLLSGINDTIEVLQKHCLELSNHGVVPYYLFQLDRVQGSQHFEVSVEKGKELMDALIELLPGYAVPKYAQEIPHKKSKTLL